MRRGGARAALRPRRAGMVRLSEPCVFQACYELLAERAASFDEEGARAHRRIADFQSTTCLGPCTLAEALEGRLQSCAHDRLGQRARRVVGAGAAAFLGRLQIGAPGAIGAFLGEPRSSSSEPRASTGAGTSPASSTALCDIRRELVRVGLLFQELEPILALLPGEPVEIDEHRRWLFCGADREGAPRRRFAVKPITVSYTEPTCSTSSVR